MAENYLSKLPRDLNTLIKGYSRPDVCYHVFNQMYDAYRVNDISNFSYYHIGIYLTLEEAVSGLLSYCKSNNLYLFMNHLYIIETKFGSIDLNNAIIGYKIVNNKLTKYLFVHESEDINKEYAMISTRKAIEQPL